MLRGSGYAVVLSGPRASDYIMDIDLHISSYDPPYDSTVETPAD
jgi:hypothetical protein